MNIATLGVQSFKDDLYREIGKGFHEASSLSLATAIYYWIGYGVAFGLFLVTRKTRSLVDSLSDTEKELDDLEAIANGNKGLSKPEEDIHVRISKQRLRISSLAPKAKLMHKAAYGLFALGIAFFAWMLIGSAKAIYINSAIVHYEQSLSIVTPLATNEELAALESRYSQISSKGNYESVISDIADIGERAQQKIPDFKVW